MMNSPMSVVSAPSGAGLELLQSLLDFVLLTAKDKSAVQAIVDDLAAKTQAANDAREAAGKAQVDAMSAQEKASVAIDDAQRQQAEAARARADADDYAKARTALADQALSDAQAQSAAATAARREAEQRTRDLDARDVAMQTSYANKMQELDAREHRLAARENELVYALADAQRVRETYEAKVAAIRNAVG